MIVTAVNRLIFVCGMSYMILRGCWCDVIVMNVRASTKDEIVDMGN
jgi:hypothetical protein